MSNEKKKTPTIGVLTVFFNPIAADGTVGKKTRVTKLAVKSDDGVFFGLQASQKTWTLGDQEVSARMSGSQNGGGGGDDSLPDID